MAADLGPTPETLLAQIRALLEQYLALGSDTPVAAEAQALLGAIDSSGTAAMTEGSPPPDLASAEEMGAAMPPMKLEGPSSQLLEGEEGYSGTDMGEARQGALELLKNRNRRAKAAS
jgi:hypothetical protein